MRRTVLQLLAVLIALLGGSLPNLALAGTRVALVIGNGGYLHTAALENPRNDASLVESSLLKSGFRKVDILRVDDASKSKMHDVLSEFRRRAEGADIAVVYFAGHGIETGGRNFLLPIDTIINVDSDIDKYGVQLDEFLSASEPAKLRLVILDACRNNPFNTAMKRRLRFQVVGKGLAEVEPDSGTLVVYSTRAGSVALDGDDANSPFATALAHRLSQPGLELGMMFRVIRTDVLTATGRQQEPFTFGPLPSEEIYLRPAKLPRVAIADVLTEGLVWQGAIAAQTPGAFQGYLNRYSDGQFSADARSGLERLRANEALDRTGMAQAQTDKGSFAFSTQSTIGSIPRATSATALAASYKREFVGLCRTVAADRFPFDTNSLVAISPEDFKRTLAAGGSLDTFINRNLLPLIDTSGEQWTWRNDREAARSFHPDTALQFQNAAEIRDFLADGLTMSARLNELGQGVDAAELVTGGHTYRFDTSHPGPMAVVWKVYNDADEIRLTLYRDGQVVGQVAEQGPWNLLRLVKRARITKNGPRAMTARFGAGQLSAELKFDLPNDRNPFGIGFWSFKCPPGL